MYAAGRAETDDRRGNSDADTGLPPERLVLTLTESQVALLVAMDAGVQMRINRSVVWLRRRPYAMADLYALRAAGLVRSAETLLGPRGPKGFELTDRGVTEAQRLTDQRRPTTTASPPTPAAYDQPSDHVGAVTC